MFLNSLAKSLPRLASIPAFLCLVVAHLEWPLTNCPSRSRRLRRPARPGDGADRKSTRLNSSHANISYAVFCLKKKNNQLLHHHSSRHPLLSFGSASSSYS